MNQHKQKKRIVVTGLGAISPLGWDVETNWSQLLAGKSGVSHLDNSIVQDLQVKIGARVPNFKPDEEGSLPEKILSHKDKKKMDRFIQLALIAADEAISMSGWTNLTPQQAERTATVIASGIGGFPAIVEAVRLTDKRGARRLSPFVIPSFLANLASGHITIKYGYTGPIGTPVTACAAGVQAIGDAVRMIQCNEADIAICGGAEACIDTVSLGGFSAARALSTSFNSTPKLASRPFDSSRDGFIMGEGAGVLVIETLEHAMARGAKPIAEIAGYGTTADAFHMTSGPEDGRGAARSMKLALDSAMIEPHQIQHINAHSTSTPVGDKCELLAIKSIFGDVNNIAISATKSATGHLLGAAGGLEAIYTILAIRDQIVPPSLNIKELDPAAEGLNIVRDEAKKLRVDHALSNGFGFGGVNASLVFSKFKE